MKKSIILIAVAAVTAFSACKSSPASIGKTEIDTLSYAIGWDVANMIKPVDSTLNIDVIASGIRDNFNGKTALTEEEIYAFMQEYFMVRKPAKAKQESEDFIASIEKSNKKAVKSESGLVYEIVELGDMSVKAVNDADTVVATYKGTFPNGEVFDANEEIPFPLNGVIAGWTEGIKYVGKGGKINLWIPADLAYGERGRGNIPGNQALAFEIEVIDIKPYVEK